MADIIIALYDNEYILIALVICIPLILFIISDIKTKKQTKKRKQMVVDKVKDLANGAIEMTPQEFLTLRAETRGNAYSGQGIMKLNEITGIYILFNKTKNKYYVGQGVKVMDRVNNHFTGKGNGDVYADYKYGDEFTIKMISLRDSGYNTLNALERDAIETYGAYANGYNKTRGNSDWKY